MIATPVAACRAGGEDVQVSPAGLELGSVTVTTADGDVHDFTVELALSPEEQRRGMMDRQSLAPDRGMLFVYEQPEYRSFWMKNTYIPLDIIYIGGDGRILSIEADTIPLSIDPYPSLDPALLVLELAGGRAAELGIEPGDVVTWER